MTQKEALKPIWFFETNFSILCILIGIILKFLELNLDIQFRMSSLIIILVAAVLVGPGGVLLYKLTKRYDFKAYAIMLVSGVNICGLVALTILGWDLWYFLFFIIAILLFLVIKPNEKELFEKN